ncbi:Odorant receptor 131-2 [Merluccius polli]|uniref:Odorant receptor 131-2 n=1 Tax=Merluccius polli TaxID=89951 RepID=A0AA47M8E3_MERPO|nr:Odorant receptor 131-2 [Merluccius polli]
MMPRETLTIMQLKANITVGLQYQTSQELLLFTILSVVLSCTFLYLNCVLLYTLRSKPVFCETSRYILLYNLLFADTAYLLTSLLLYILAVCRLKLKLYVCGFLTSICVLEDIISPLTLAVMSMERYVAVCFPLRHADLVTVRNTGAVIAVVWIISGLHVLIQALTIVILRQQFDFDEEMKDFCSKEAMFLAPTSSQVDKAFSGSVFTLGGLVTILSYVGVTLAARSALTDKASASKAGKTVLLHMIQLVLILISTVYSSILTAFLTTVDRRTLVRLYNIIFVCLNLFPRCLSALIYGLRDQTIRPALLKNLFCLHLRCFVSNKTMAI